MRKTMLPFIGFLTTAGVTLAAMAETTPVVSVNESVDGFYNEATIDQRFVTSPRARPTDLVN